MISTILIIILSVALLAVCFRLLAWPYNKTWKRLFNDGQAPKSLVGPNGESQEWSIRMVTGPLLSMNFWPLNHRKRISAVTSTFELGHNRLFKKFVWGKFLAKDKPNNSSLLDYSSYTITNSFLTRRIQDLVRTTPNPNVMVGKFYYKLFGKYRFLGFFTMTRIP